MGNQHLRRHQLLSQLFLSMVSNHSQHLQRNQWQKLCSLFCDTYYSLELARPWSTKWSPPTIAPVHSHSVVYNTFPAKTSANEQGKASDVPRMTRMVSNNIMLCSNAQREIWASSCSLFRGAVRPITGGVISELRSMGSAYLIKHIGYTV